MTECSYGNWQGVKSKRNCRRIATFVGDMREGKLRQFCPHHAAIAQALGWKVYNVYHPYELPRFNDDARLQRTA